MIRGFKGSFFGPFFDQTTSHNVSGDPKNCDVLRDWPPIDFLKKPNSVFSSTSESGNILTSEGPKCAEIFDQNRDFLTKKSLLGVFGSLGNPKTGTLDRN